MVEALTAFALDQRPELVVMSGDITQRARAAQFRDARRFVDRLGAPVIIIPGNHDIPLFNVAGRLLRPYQHFMTAFGDNLEPEHSSADLLLLGVNTTRWYRHKNGEVSKAQIERVATRLATASHAQLRIVVVHQPLAVRQATDAHDRLRGYAMAARRWAAAGADLVLGGHIHLPYVMAVPDVKRALWVVQAGTAVSSRVRAGTHNSVNVLRWGRDIAGGTCVIEQWDFAAESRRFLLAATTSVRPSR